jgi:Uma2 family endonuclease
MSGTIIAPTTIVSERSWTVSQIERWPDAERFELIGGILYMTAMPRAPHPEIVDNLDDLLGPWVRKKRLGRVLGAQTGLYLNEVNYVDPDLLFIRKEQMPRRGERYSRAALAVEVLSPSNLRAPRADREQRFADLQVEELWYIDPNARTLEVRRLSGAAYAPAAVFRAEDMVTSQVLPGFGLPLSALWEDLSDELPAQDSSERVP